MRRFVAMPGPWGFGTIDGGRAETSGPSVLEVSQRPIDEVVQGSTP